MTTKHEIRKWTIIAELHNNDLVVFNVCFSLPGIWRGIGFTIDQGQNNFNVFIQGDCLLWTSESVWTSWTRRVFLTHWSINDWSYPTSTSLSRLFQLNFDDSFSFGAEQLVKQTSIRTGTDLLSLVTCSTIAFIFVFEISKFEKLNWGIWIHLCSNSRMYSLLRS